MEPEVKIELIDQTLDFPLRVKDTWRLASPWYRSVMPGQWLTMPLGIAVEIPDGYVGVLTLSSSLASHGVIPTCVIFSGKKLLCLDLHNQGNTLIMARNEHVAELHVVRSLS
jgi:dUTPase